MHRASHALSKIQYVHASNLGMLKFGVLKKLFIHYEHGTKAVSLLDFSPAGFKRFLTALAEHVYLVTIVFSEQDWLRMTSI
jgi:hypothetical protein